MPGDRSLDDIMLAARTARLGLADLVQHFQELIDTINSSAATEGRALSREETLNIELLLANQSAIGKALKALALVNAVRLRRPAKVRSLQQRMGKISRSLRDERERLGQIHSGAEIFANVQDSTDRTIQLLSALPGDPTVFAPPPKKKRRF